MIAEPAPIVLHHDRAPAVVRRDDVYFAFASGCFAYDCHTCNAQCCRGHGYSVRLGPELEAGLRSRPSLKFFLEKNGTGTGNPYHAGNCPPACFFLNQSGLCSIHAEQGAAAKPETCRLFPFNSFRRLGSFLVVCPHSWLCPLNVVPAGVADAQSTYSNLLNEMAASGIASDVPDCKIPAGVQAASVIMLEREIVRLSEVHAHALRYRDYFEAQVLATRRVAGEQHSTVKGDSTLAILERMARILGLAVETIDTADQHLARVTIAITPTLRSWAVFRPSSANAANDIPLGRLPHAMLATHVIAGLARSAGMKEITYQTITRLGRDFEPLLYVLAHADCPMQWMPGVMLDLRAPKDKWFATAFLRLSKDLLPSRQERARVTLGDLVSDACGPGDSLDRIVFLKALAKYLYGRLMPVDTPSPIQPRSLGLRSAIQRFALAHLDQSHVLAIAERLERARSKNSPRT
jgi:Fe-S-cluster containining protein